MNTGSEDSPRRLAPLTLAALGVVYGDIGTSPLYAVRECFYSEYGVAPTEANVLGVLSLVFWSLILVISVKYLVFVLRADHYGEGGILALMELVRRPLKGRTRTAVMALGLFGAALLYGDGMITPAISVLSAIEGLEVATPVFQPYVVPITIGILGALFAVQRLGTGGVGIVFGPVMLVWFACIGLAGVPGILENPAVFSALNPWHAVAFFRDNGAHALVILGIVFLVVTGGEALYADLGHFGRAPIRLGWYIVVLPGLLLNYFGQGALILREGDALVNPFYQLVPGWALYPMVALATLATIIASQAIISGAFSLTFQGQNLGYLPTVKVVHTSWRHRGQIYVPAVNWLLLVAAVALVAGFQRSGNLAAAYGIAISATMLVTTILLYFAERRIFRWALPLSLAATVLFIIPDTAYFVANAGKFMDGGWLPIGVAGAVYLVMTTWRRGRATEQRHMRNQATPVRDFLAALSGGYYRRVPGQAVYLAANERGTPHGLIHNLNHNRALHRLVVIYTAKTLRRPRVQRPERLKVTRLRDDIYRVVAYYGYMEEPKPRDDLEQANAEHGIGLDTAQATYFLEEETEYPARRTGMAWWRSWLYVLIRRNTRRTTLYFDLPPEQVFEVGVRMRI
ncbi:MAG: potassium transporter Kup [Gammaproteobacteria bacterium]|nr:potassium transporter Kup [Gammaproteobacteria bacterium]